MSSAQPHPQAGWRLCRQTFSAPVDLLQLAEATALDDANGIAFYWQHPETRRALLAVGAVQHFVADGPERIASVAAAARRAMDDIDASLPARPMVVGGFAFGDATSPSPDALPGCWFFLPHRLWHQQGEQTVLREIDAPTEPFPTRASSTSAAATPSNTPWDERVERVLDLIHRGTVDKVVLSQRRQVGALESPLRPLLAELRQQRPQCVTFAVRRDTTVFFGSSPELMLQVDASGFRAPALAGTLARGQTPEEDDRRAVALLACLKNRREHRAVVDGIGTSLRRLGIPAEISDTGIVRLPEAMHLRTNIHGRFPKGMDLLRAVAELHPTPAVCGTPRAHAAAFLREHEPDRGWYTGGIGWMDCNGEGEVVVGLRSALSDTRGLTVCGGAGIVAGSQSDDELAETELKMDAMLAPLRAVAARSLAT